MFHCAVVVPKSLDSALGVGGCFDFGKSKVGVVFHRLGLRQVHRQSCVVVVKAGIVDWIFSVGFVNDILLLVLFDHVVVTTFHKAPIA